MPKRAISPTLDEESLTWVRGQALAGRPSGSEMVDRILREARAGGRGALAAVRSILGTVRLSSEDPDLLAADEAARAEFIRSLGQRVTTARPARTVGGARRDGRGQGA
jgi:hypothetical protein